MVHMLSLTENLHTILRVLYDDMMVLCYPMSQVAMAIAGIGALLYIAYRVWQSLAQAEPIDLFPLMRPFAIGICILFFPTLVLGSLNGILSPLVKATHSLMAGQTLDMEQWQERRERLELEGREQKPPDSNYAEDEEMERELRRAYEEGFEEGRREGRGGYGERGGYGQGGGYGERGEYDRGGYEYDDAYGERRGVRGTGPYSRYRRR